MKEIQPGTRFGRLVVIGSTNPKTDNRGKRHASSACKCDCGNLRTAKNSDLRRSTTRSCGCLSKEVAAAKFYRHGNYAAIHRGAYHSWRNMIRRTSDSSDIGYKNYGARGIKVCERWRSFEAFLSDMGNRPPELMLERINNDGNYEPENCKWATRTEQTRNTRRNRNYTAFGVTACLEDLSVLHKLKPTTVRRRLEAGLTIERALTMPLVPVNLRRQRQLSKEIA